MYLNKSGKRCSWWTIISVLSGGYCFVIPNKHINTDECRAPNRLGIYTDCMVKTWWYFEMLLLGNSFMMANNCDVCIFRKQKHFDSHYALHPIHISYVSLRFNNNVSFSVSLQQWNVPPSASSALLHSARWMNHLNIQGTRGDAVRILLNKIE